jgi:hypothetical protein
LTFLFENLENIFRKMLKIRHPKQKKTLSWRETRNNNNNNNIK